jgi:Tol biopolymer transport system component
VLSRCVFALCILAGCSFSTSGGAIDASVVVDRDAPPDGSPDGSSPSCLDRWMAHDVDFLPPTRLVALGSTADDRDPYISGDQLRLYFASERTVTSKVYVSTRSSVSDSFPTPALATDLNSTSSDSKISITADDETVVIASSRAGSDSGSVDLWLGARATTTLPFAGFTRTPFPTVNTSDYQLDPEIGSDGLRIYYADTIAQRIVVASRAASLNVFGSPTILINSGFGDSDPSLSPDEKLLLFSSNRPTGMGGGDMWYTTRASATATTLDEPMPVPLVNGPSSDGDPSLSRDGCTLYFSSNRDGNYELYVTTMTP